MVREGQIQQVALGVDVRSGESLKGLQAVLEQMAIEGINYEILFLDSSDDVLVKRYKGDGEIILWQEKAAWMRA